MKLSLVSTAAAAVVLLGSASVYAENATGVVAYRQAVMKSFGAHTAAIKSILTEQTQPLDQVVPHAEAISSLASHLPAMFPAGSDSGETYALPSIWEKPDEFKSDSDVLAELSADLAEAATGGDAQATLAAFAKMGKEGCGECHGDFRKKD
ncbi:MAG: cytochrome c [Geminicoccaceae bacterium]|nr:cytochrome c [Geminicoccaceae bacterium]